MLGAKLGLGKVMERKKGFESFRLNPSFYAYRSATLCTI